MPWLCMLLLLLLRPCYFLLRKIISASQHDPADVDYGYSTLGGKTDKLDEAVNRELNVTKSLS